MSCVIAPPINAAVLYSELLGQDATSNLQIKPETKRKTLLLTPSEVFSKERYPDTREGSPHYTSLRIIQPRSGPRDAYLDISWKKTRVP